MPSGRKAEPAAVQPVRRGLKEPDDGAGQVFDICGTGKAARRVAAAQRVVHQQTPDALGEVVLVLGQEAGDTVEVEIDKLGTLTTPVGDVSLRSRA